MFFNKRNTDKPLTGYRLYKLSFRPGELSPQLVGAFGTFWPTASLDAECDGQYYMFGIPYKAPETGTLERRNACRWHLSKDICSCGIYIAKDHKNETVKSYLQAYYNFSVLARVTGYGVCVEGEKGMRCESVKIDALYHFNRHSYGLAEGPIGTRLTERYKVPIIDGPRDLKHGMKELEKLCRLQ